MTGARTGAAIRCDCGRQLTPSGGQRVLHCTCGRIWQALVHTRTTGATAWIPSTGTLDRRCASGPGGSAPGRSGRPALSLLGSFPGRVSLVPALWPAGGTSGARTQAGRAWRPRLV
ncbi:MAG TPA: DUF1922 domain-containing protein [Candidatus Dormibacteraeota bacterium]|jgi:hypothetical protein|nr:DUF1922 domain-containing protein [Candidatus Dormibacteraeota bacterium]